MALENGTVFTVQSCASLLARGVSFSLQQHGAQEEGRRQKGREGQASRSLVGFGFETVGFRV